MIISGVTFIILAAITALFLGLFVGMVAKEHKIIGLLLLVVCAALYFVVFGTATEEEYGTKIMESYPLRQLDGQYLLVEHTGRSSHDYVMTNEGEKISYDKVEAGEGNARIEKRSVHYQSLGLLEYDKVCWVVVLPE